MCLAYSITCVDEENHKYKHLITRKHKKIIFFTYIQKRKATVLKTPCNSTMADLETFLDRNHQISSLGAQNI